MEPPKREVDILILGAGWTFTFLEPQLKEHKISYAATSTTGHNNTIEFKFDPDSDDKTPYNRLPLAKTVVIIFPLKGQGQSRKLTHLYAITHDMITVNWIQLGSTGIYQGDGWSDHTSPIDKENARAVAEEELLELNDEGRQGCVLNLAGLYGGERDPRNWLSRVAKDKEQLRAKGALHLIHGEDVARAIIATSRRFVGHERWIVTDQHVYDWYDLFDSWGGELLEKWFRDGKQGERPMYKQWVAECMEEDDIKALPRSVELVGRRLDARKFWRTMRTEPLKRLPR